MNPMITIVVLGLLWLVIVFPLYLHYRKEISIRSKSTSLISGKVVGYNSSIYSRHGEPPQVVLPLVEYTVRGKTIEKDLSINSLSLHLQEESKKMSFQVTMFTARIGV